MSEAKIWVDADSCPRSVREIIQRASRRTGIAAFFVANRPLPGIAEAEGFIKVGRGEGVADDYIVEHCGPNDLIVTRDIPLAKRLVDHGNRVINDRGNVFTSENVGERLSVRNFMHQLRLSGLLIPTERSFGSKEVQSFANAFDRELTRIIQNSY